MSPTPDEYEAAAIERVEEWVRAGGYLPMALHAERAHLYSLPLNPATRQLLQRLVDFPSTTYDFDKTPVSVRLAFDELRDAARKLLKERS